MGVYTLPVDISVGLHTTITMDARVTDYTGWTFEATFADHVADTDGIHVAMAGADADDGFRIIDGPDRLVSLRLKPATLQAYPNSTGRFALCANILATPPLGERFHAFGLRLDIWRFPTP